MAAVNIVAVIAVSVKNPSNRPRNYGETVWKESNSKNNYCNYYDRMVYPDHKGLVGGTLTTDSSTHYSSK